MTLTHDGTDATPGNGATRTTDRNTIGSMSLGDDDPWA